MPLFAGVAVLVLVYLATAFCFAMMQSVVSCGLAPRRWPLVTAGRIALTADDELRWWPGSSTRWRRPSRR